MTDIADIMIHVHQNLLSVHRVRLEEEVSVLGGVISACFSKDNTHELTVIYSTDSIDSSTILHRVRQWDKDAVFF